MNSTRKIEELRSVVTALLEWIDAVPKDTVLPSMPGVDRDWVDSVLYRTRLGYMKNPCASYRKYDGRWEVCRNEAVVRLTTKFYSKHPVCKECRDDVVSCGTEVLSTEPITDTPNEESK